MRSSTATLLLQACDELGLLVLRDLFREAAFVATGGKAFTSAELCAHAALPENGRLREAIERSCGEVSPRKLGKILAKWEGVDVASLRVDCVGDDPAGILWIVSDAKPIPAKTPVANGDNIAALPLAARKRHVG